MPPFFQQLFEYDNHFNSKLIVQVTANREQVSEKCMALINHILNAHRIWNARILPGETPFESWQMHPLEELAGIQQKNFEDSLRIIKSTDLDQLIPYTTARGQAFEHAVRDILFQVINHSTYHRAQIATEFRHSGLEPLLTDYIFYKMTVG